MSIVKFEFSYNIETGEFSVVNTETGEIKSTKKAKKSVDTGECTLTLEDNKYKLSNAAVDLINPTSEDKFEIAYDAKGNPILRIGSKGNKLTKSHTVAFRGSQNAELAKHGTVFTVERSISDPNMFILEGDNETVSVIEDEAFSLEGLEDLVDGEDITEIDSNFFNI